MAQQWLLHHRLNLPLPPPKDQIPRHQCYSYLYSFTLLHPISSHKLPFPEQLTPELASITIYTFIWLPIAELSLPVHPNPPPLSIRGAWSKYFVYYTKIHLQSHTKVRDIWYGHQSRPCRAKGLLNQVSGKSTHSTHSTSNSNQHQQGNSPNNNNFIIISWSLPFPWWH